jgi:8-oxo-dGTP pyrophosphatase MutT (NUDIX family)
MPDPSHHRSGRPGLAPPNPNAQAAVPVFGTPVEGEPVTPRRAAYAVIAGPHDGVAVVETRLGLFLPGGGAHSGETPVQAARRECLEEIARQVRFIGGMREALQHFSVDGRHFRMEAVFLEAQFTGEPQGHGEHDLHWATARDANRFFHRSHAWAAGFLPE